MQKVTLAVFALVVIGTASATSLGRNNIVLPVIRSPPECKNAQYWMEGDIPDPFNCHQFYTCAPAEGGTTAAQLRTCPDNLQFSFITCRCEFDGSGCCSSCTNSEFFNCTTIYVPSDKESSEAASIKLLR